MKNLSIHQISVFLTIFNATQIARSLGQLPSFKKNEGKLLSEYKDYIFRETDNLISKIKNKTITFASISRSIKKCANEFKISYGQSQKAINVFLKFYFYFYYVNNLDIKKCLHCPLDSKIMNKLKEKKIMSNVKKLNGITEKEYFGLQNEIGKLEIYKIDFDTEWDKQFLERHFTNNFYKELIKTLNH